MPASTQIRLTSCGLGKQRHAEGQLSGLSLPSKLQLHELPEMAPGREKLEPAFSLFRLWGVKRAGASRPASMFRVGPVADRQTAQTSTVGRSS